MQLLPNTSGVVRGLFADELSKLAGKKRAVDSDGPDNSAEGSMAAAKRRMLFQAHEERKDKA